jgi:hypothetical protein
MNDQDVLWAAQSRGRMSPVVRSSDPNGLSSVSSGGSPPRPASWRRGRWCELVALAIAISIVAHSMTDAPFPKAFDIEGFGERPRINRRTGVRKRDPQATGLMAVRRSD